MTDYTAQAQALLASAKLIPHPEDDPPGYEVDLIDELNLGIGVAAASEDEARAKVVDSVVAALQRRDPNYIPPVVPSAADSMLAAIDALDPKTATVEDVIGVAKSALVDVGASVAPA